MFDQRVCFAGPGEKGHLRPQCGNTRGFLGDCMKNEVMIFSSFLLFGTGFITRSITAKNNNFFGIFRADSCR